MPGPAESSGPLSLAPSPGDKIANLEVIVPLSPLSQNPPSAPLLQRGERGDFCIHLFGNRSIGSLHHSIGFFQNFSTVEAQHLQTERGQVAITALIFQGVIASQVLGAIHFHDQSCAWREEIHLKSPLPPFFQRGVM